MRYIVARKPMPQENPTKNRTMAIAFHLFISDLLLPEAKLISTKI
jgi:hypothetical protein